MKYLTRLYFLWALIFLTACGADRFDIEKVPMQNPPGAPADARPVPLSFNQIRFSIPTGTPIVARTVTDPTGWGGCEAPYGFVQSGISSRSFPDDHYRRIFVDTLSGQGYDVAGDPGRMFDEEEDLMRANYAVGARVTDLKINACKDKALWGFVKGETGEGMMSIEWTVFDLLNRRNVYKTTTRGYAQVKLPNYEALDLLKEQTFAAAANNLGAQKEFHDLVFFGVEPKDVPNTWEDVNENTLTNTSVPEKIGIGLVPVSSQSAKGRLEQIREAAVMIEAGGGHASGFFITREGHIITNAHAVGNAERVRVVSSGKKEKMIAQVLRMDRKRDVALIKLEKLPEDLNITLLPLRLGEPDVGETVYAIGAPKLKRLQDSVTSGIISANRYDQEKKQPYIQADVDIYGGNSGGPLVDANGNIIGISVLGYFVAPQTMGGLNWFVPIADALEKLDITYE